MERTVVRALLDGTVASDQPQEQPQGDDDVGQPIIEPKNGG
jgi:hypothetical protein